MFNSNLFKWITVSTAVLGLSACQLPGMQFESEDSDPGLEQTVELVRLNAATLAHQNVVPGQDLALQKRLPAVDDKYQYKYLVGPLDVLDITVWGRPELNNPGGMTQTAESRGRQVRSDGTIFYPFVGVLPVAGMTVEEIRGELSRRLSQYINEPQVDVRVSIFRAQKFYVTGEVEQPGVQYLNNEPTTLMDAVARSGGMGPEADLRVATLTRNGVTYPVDLLELYQQGGIGHNILMRNEDTLHIQDNRANLVFVMGEVEKQTSVPMHKGKMSLVEALSGAEGVSLSFADASQIYVIRKKPWDPQLAKCLQQPLKQDNPCKLPIATVFHLDAQSPDALVLADSFQLAPRDVVFVATSDLTRWNRVVQQILPTIQTIFQTDALIRRR